MVVPPRLVDPLVEARKALDIHTGVVEQLTMAELIRCGDYDRTIRRSRLTYRRRRDQLVAMVTRHAPQVEVTGLAAGLHALLYLPGALEHERRVVREASDRGLELRGLEPLRVEPRESDRAGLVVGYGTPPGHAYSGALAALAQVLAG
jgi:GntR family transcriptional regulator/MocR family aminotransferase